MRNASVSSFAVVVAALALGLAPASASQAVPLDSWSPSTQLDSIRFGNGMDVVGSPQGTFTAIWADNSVRDTDIEVSESSVSSAWSAKRIISLPNTNNSIPKIVTDAHGNLTAVWASTASSVTTLVSAQKSSGGSWTAPRIITTAIENPYWLNLAVSSTGDVAAIWHDVKPGTSELRVQAIVRSSSGTWGAMTTLSGPTEDDDRPDVIFSSTGTLTAVWRQLLGGNHFLHQATMPRGGSWGADRIVTPQTTNIDSYDLAYTGGNRLVVAWHVEGANIVEFGDITPGSTPSTPVQLSTVGRQAHEPAIVSGGGSTTVAWTESNSIGLQIVTVAHSTNEATWTTDQAYSNAAAYSGSVNLATDAVGDLLLSWSEQRSYTNKLFVATKPATGTWAPGVAVFADGAGTLQPILASDSHGDGVAFWSWTPMTFPPPNATIQASTRYVPWVSPSALPNTGDTNRTALVELAILLSLLGAALLGAARIARR